MERTERIKAMEKRLEAALLAVGVLESALEAYADVSEDIRILADYLSSPEWRGDLSADERGLLPPELKRGVLSEDGIYGLLEREAEMRARALELFAPPDGEEI